MIDSSTRNSWDMDDRALLQAIALSLNPRLQTAETADAETTPGAGCLSAGRAAGRAYGDDV